MDLPKEIYYSDTGGKSAPLYVALKGVKSALTRLDQESPVWRGTVTWTEIDPATGEEKGT